MSDAERTVLDAADTLVRAFMAHDKAGYFRCFAPAATFLFPNVAGLIRDRAAYEALWSQWEEQDGFRVVGGGSANRHLAMFGDTAIFTHDVTTTLTIAGETRISREQETIVFHTIDGRWLAVHEHLSPAPVL